MLRLCYICWGHNFIFLSGTALPFYQMDDAMVKWMCGFVLLHLMESQSKADIFSRLPFVYHFSSQWEESYCWTKHFWLPNQVTDLLSVITHRVTDFGIGQWGCCSPWQDKWLWRMSLYLCRKIDLFLVPKLSKSRHCHITGKASIPTYRQPCWIRCVRLKSDKT